MRCRRRHDQAPIAAVAIVPIAVTATASSETCIPHGSVAVAASDGKSNLYEWLRWPSDRRPAPVIARIFCSSIAFMGNPFVHLDLSTSDPAAAKKFYGDVFDWNFNDIPEMNWTGIDVGEGVGGGLGPKQNPDQPTAWTAYVGVDDVDATVAKAAAAGATIMMPRMEVPGMGWLAVFIDPQGASVGVWQPMTPPPRPKAEKKAAKKEKKAAKKQQKKAAKKDKKATKPKKAKASAKAKRG
jgi:predicted enzyme related to lactoylglutathione lyase